MARSRVASPSSDAVLPGAPITAERQDLVFRLFASAVYFTFFLVCLMFVFRNCRIILPGSARAQRALCPAAESAANHFPILGGVWDKLATDVFPITRPHEEAVFYFLSRLTILVLGPLSILLAWQFLKGWPKQRLVLVHSYFWSLFAVATAVAVQLEHLDNAQWAQAQHVVVSVFAFWILFPIAVSVSTLPRRGSTFGGGVRVVTLLSAIATVATVYEFAVDYVPAAKGSPSVADFVTGQAFATAAAPHLESVRKHAASGFATVQKGASDAFDVVAEQSAAVAGQAAPHVQSALAQVAEVATTTSKSLYARIMEAIKGDGKPADKKTK